MDDAWDMSVREQLGGSLTAHIGGLSDDAKKRKQTVLEEQGWIRPEMDSRDNNIRIQASVWEQCVHENEKTWCRRSNSR